MPETGVLALFFASFMPLFRHFAVTIKHSAARVFRPLSLRTSDRRHWCGNPSSLAPGAGVSLAAARLFLPQRGRMSAQLTGEGESSPSRSAGHRPAKASPARGGGLAPRGRRGRRLSVLFSPKLRKPGPAPFWSEAGFPKIIIRIPAGTPPRSRPPPR